MTSKRYLQTLTWLRRRLKSNKPINDPNYSPRYQQFLKIMKKKLEKTGPLGIRLNSVTDELGHNLEGKGKQLEFCFGRVSLRITYYKQIY